ncbi:zinc finger protein, putative [Schistosoma mansoni]|uniref:Zinc finger protein, putative n=1 Tax=Schistosoma mansoni TaxID=6183 RepID=G4M129_SCHMA|nr:zinc finger protein, putative [Schistosoma mansoni]|eukprot:XP_018647194.1 zinc finger protein, putative [Schistosoma mansoni]
MVFETHDILKYLSNMQTNWNTMKTTDTSLQELVTNHIQEDRSLRNTICHTTGQIQSRQGIINLLADSKHEDLIHSPDEFTHFPNNIQMIINKTWKTYYQQDDNAAENKENIDYNNTKLYPTSAICTCQANDSIIYPSCSTTSSDSIMANQLKNQLQGSCIERQTKLRPRPLLRQKENDEHYINDLLVESRLVTCQNELQSTSNTHRPMQVHMRYPIPRKQDAIYNARYKTQPCLHYQKYKHCPLGDNCHFAHGPNELKYPQFHPKYRTRICMNYANNGTCPYGNNCYFLHFTPMSSTQNNHTTTNTKINNNRTVAKPWNIDHFIQDDSNISNISNNHHMDTMILSSNLRRVTI